MATLLLSAVGTVFGGPLGGVIGALIGRQVDSRLLAPSQKGPRLKELAVTTSSYGMAIPRHFGRMRVAGTVIWATDLAEHRQRSGGGKGKPKVTAYTYSSSFAVALSSRPIRGVGRIWADGNLLRGAAGDLKVAGTFRLHTGEADQEPDPLIVAAEGADSAPAFRGMAYAVFENLQLADFGNRIPTLSFEIIADDGPIVLADLLSGDLDAVDADVALPGLAGFSVEGALDDALAVLDPVWPLDCDACAPLMTFAPERRQAAPLGLPEAAISVEDGDFGGADGRQRKRGGSEERPALLRYYDIDRDYQPGIQRAAGRPADGQPRGIELPAALAATDARRLIEAAARDAGWARETLSWRSADLDPRIGPGAIVTVPGESGVWRVGEWDWRASGVELHLRRIAPSALIAQPVSDAGRAATPADVIAGASRLYAFELPWDGVGGGDVPALFAAVGSDSPGWSGAALFADPGDGQLVPLGPSPRRRATIGTCIDALGVSSPLLFDREHALEIELTGADVTLADASPAQIAVGANRALVGGEIIQFCHATPLQGARWRLSGLLRGRGGTEAGIADHAAGEAFVLLDDAIAALDPALVGNGAAPTILASGLADTAPASAMIGLRGITLRPLTPVHPRIETAADGGLILRWTRRSRGAWLWSDGVDVPINEQGEAYEVTLGDPAAPAARWDLAEPRLSIPPALRAELASMASGAIFRVRQRGSYALSLPLLLGPIPL